MFKNAVVVLALIVVTLAACESVAVDPTPAKEPQKIDCDLIFPMPIEKVPPSDIR